MICNTQIPLGELRIGNMPLMLFLILLLLSGCSKKNAKGDPYLGENALSEQKSLIEKHISDPGKQRKLLQIVADFEMKLNDFNERQVRHYKDMEALTADYKTTQEDFENIIGDFNTEYEALLKSLAARRMEMKGLVTPEEWKAISGKRKKSVLTN